MINLSASVRKMALIALSFSITHYSFSQTGPAGAGNSTNTVTWLDAHALSLSDGASVALWDDISGNSNHYDQGSSTLQPTFQESGINGLPSISFDGVNDVLASNAIPALDSDHVTWFMVYEMAGLSRDMVINAAYASNSEKWKTYSNNGDNRLVSAQYSPSINWVRYVYTPGEPSFLSTHVTPTVITTYNQGNFELDRTAAYTTPSGHEKVLLGRRSETGTNPYIFEGLLSEVIIYNSGLNDLERIMVENYLGAKYNMAIPTDHFDYEDTHSFGLIGIGDDGTNTQTTAQGAGVLEISGATDLDADEYLLAAHTDFDLSDFDLDDLPASLPEHQRFTRSWRVDETGDVGTVTLTFNLGGDDFATEESYRLLVDTDGTFEDATIIAGTYDAGSVSFDVDLEDGQFFTLSGILEILEIHSITDGLWSEGSTWDCDCTPGANDEVYIDPSTTVTVDVDGFTHFFRVEFLGTLVMDTDVTLDVNGDMEILGDLNLTDGTISFTGEVEQTITNITTLTLTSGFHNIHVENTNPGNVTFVDETFTLSGTLSPIRGNIVINPGTEFRVLSTSATEGGNIGPIISPTTITGNFSVERFIASGESDWRGLASPVIGSTFDDWDPDLEMSGPDFPDGCAFGPEGCFNSVRYTNHSIEVNVNSSTDEILNTRGYDLYCGDDLEAWSGTTLTSTGTLNTSADVVKAYNTGWTTTGNPYASPIAFSSLVRSGSQIGNYFYVYDPSIGAYQWYDGASGTSSIPDITSEGLIATGQSVWIFASSAGSLTFRQEAKRSVDALYIRTADRIDPTLQVTLSEIGSTYSCTLYLEENDATTDGADEEFDIRHLEMEHQKGPSFAVYTDDEAIRKNYIQNDGRDKTFQLYSNVLNEGYYRISADNWANFRFYHKILLHDSFTGETVNLKDGDYTYHVSLDRRQDQRFTLILSNEISAGSSGISSHTDITEGQVQIKQIGNVIDVVAPKTYDEISYITVTNVLGQREVFTTSANLVSGSNVISLPDDLKGFHIIAIRTGDNIVTHKVVL